MFKKKNEKNISTIIKSKKMMISWPCDGYKMRNQDEFLTDVCIKNYFGRNSDDVWFGCFVTLIWKGDLLAMRL